MPKKSTLFTEIVPECTLKRTGKSKLLKNEHSRLGLLVRECSKGIEVVAYMELSHIGTPPFFKRPRR